MGTFGSNKSGQEMQNFNEFTTGKTVITEEEKTYRYVYLWYDDPEDPDGNIWFEQEWTGNAKF